MIDIADLTHVNAALNAATMVFLGVGLWFILRGEPQRHRASMLAAFVVSVAFLISYLIYHFNAGLAKFGGEGVIRPIYFTVLIVHVVAAVVIVPLVPITLSRALAGRFDRHRKIARWTWPLWMYVALSGVVVYIMSVHLFPYTGALHAG
jgi:putative membrane protein